jgi:hypothetical protein
MAKRKIEQKAQTAEASVGNCCTGCCASGQVSLSDIGLHYDPRYSVDIGADGVQQEFNTVMSNTNAETVGAILVVPPVLDYPFNQNEESDGVNTINWRNMLRPDELYPNKDWFERNKKPVPTSVEGLEDRQLLIMLGGIKRLAKLHGYTRLALDVVESGPNRVVVKASIDWLPRPDLGYDYSIHTESLANATMDNCDDFTVKFLETIAENRAFVRCVRNFLGINIVGYDEIDKNAGKRVTELASERKTADLKDMSPNNLLSKKFGGDFQGKFKAWLRQLWIEDIFRCEAAANWQGFEDIAPQDSIRLLGLHGRQVGQS